MQEEPTSAAGADRAAVPGRPSHSSTSSARPFRCEGRRGRAGDTRPRGRGRAACPYNPAAAINRSPSCELLSAEPHNRGYNTLPIGHRHLQAFGCCDAIPNVPLFLWFCTKRDPRRPYSPPPASRRWGGRPRPETAPPALPFFASTGLAPVGRAIPARSPRVSHSCVAATWIVRPTGTSPVEAALVRSGLLARIMLPTGASPVVQTAWR